MIKITYKILENHTGKKRKKPIRKGYCKVCGSKLSDPQSVEIGIGKRCLANNVAIILEIVPDDEPANKSVQSDAANVSAEIEKVSKEIGSAFGVPAKYWQRR